MESRSLIMSVVVGALIGIALYGMTYVLTPWREPGQPVFYWVLFTAGLGGALAIVVPGLSAGYLAGRSGFLVGASAGVIAALGVSLLPAGLTWPSVTLSHDTTTTFVVNVCSGLIAAIITNGISGISGAHIAQEKSAR
jgi:hypothetical protein